MLGVPPKDSAADCNIYEVDPLDDFEDEEGDDSNDESEYKTLAIKLAPEMETAALEVFDQPEGWPVRESVEAYAVHGKHLPIRDEMRRLGRWDGRLGCYVIFVSNPNHAKLIHELGHLLAGDDSAR